MVATTPPVLIEKPTPSLPLRYGLFQAAVGPLDLPEHTETGGLRYVHSLCRNGFSYEVECPPSAQNSKTGFFGTGLETVTGKPFVVGATVTCGTVGYTEAELRAFGVEALKGVEQGVVEQVLSNATALDVAPELSAANGIITVTGGGVTPVEVISELERARYCGFGAGVAKYGPPGYLHMPIPVFNQLKSDHLIEFDGTRWRTPIGTVVSTGCYTGKDPAGADPVDGTFWVYITGQTTVWRTPDSGVFITPIEGALNRTTNQVLMMVEREYVVTFECAGYAKAVTLWP